MPEKDSGLGFSGLLSVSDFLSTAFFINIRKAVPRKNEDLNLSVRPELTRRTSKYEFHVGPML
jgi:hypothetical protein